MKNNNLNEPQPAPDVSIVMPCLNEEETLAGCIQSAGAALSSLTKAGLSGEIVISDNGSTDASIAIARDANCRVVHCDTKGYGSALIYGLNQACGKYLVMGDSDQSYDFEESVEMVLQLKKGYDLCMGNRFKGQIKKGAMPWKNRYIGNPMLSGILNLLYKTNIGDAHSGLRALTKDAFNKLKLNSTGMEFASEMVVKASLQKLKTTELPITLHVDGRNRKPHLRPFRDGWRHLKFLITLSPLWLYFIPSLILISTSIAIFSALLITPRGDVFDFGPFWIGDHWMILAGGLSLISLSISIFGLIALEHTIKTRIRLPSKKFTFIQRYITPESCAIAGAALIILGATILGLTLSAWSEQSFGALDMIREIVISTVCLGAGVQVFLTGFLLHIIRTQ